MMVYNYTNGFFSIQFRAVRDPDWPNAPWRPDVHVKVRLSTPMSDIFKGFIEAAGRQNEQLVFRHEGTRVFAMTTPKKLRLADHAIIRMHYTMQYIHAC